MHIVSEDWVHKQSIENKKLNPEDFKLPYLTGVDIGVLGFAEKTS